MTTTATTIPGRGRLARSVAAAAVVGTALVPVGALPAQAGASAKPAFSGYSTAASASPIKVEIYEPTIPIPAVPQAELSFGYSSVGADSSSSRARSSYLWPGAPVGEGFKTIIENLGLPPELAGPIGGAGYPVQVNAVYPGGPEEQRDEPLPGSNQRARAGEDEAVASNGFSTDAEVEDPDDGAGSSDGGTVPGLPGVPGLPELPGLPGLSGLPGLEGLTDALTEGLSGATGGGTAAPRDTGDTGSTAAAAPDSPAPAPGLPPELAALVDVGGFSSVSRTASADHATSQSRSGVSDVSLLGGLVTIDAVTTLARTTSNGKVGGATGTAEYGDLVAFGQRFRFGPDGYEAVGRAGAIPGLPDDATRALARLGLTISVPKAQYEIDGDAAEATVPGLVVDFDLTVLRSQLSALPLNDLVDLVPAEAGQLKSLLQAAANLSPRIVFTLGLSTSTVDTSRALPPIVPPDPAVTDPPATEGPGTTTSGGGAGGAGGGTGAATSPDGGAPVSDTPPGDGTDDLAPTAASQQPGLPALFSIPTLLFLIGVGLAGVVGTFARRMGLAVLGGASACPHGLDSGLPDLRKVQ